MNVGDIFVWVTNQAIGYEARKKYHVYLCDAGWRAEGHAFLFISKADYGGDYAIRKADYGFLSLEISFVSCNSIVCYSEADLLAARPQKVGQLSKAHLAELVRVISDSDIMEQWQINLACNALRTDI